MMNKLTRDLAHRLLGRDRARLLNWRSHEIVSRMSYRVSPSGRHSLASLKALHNKYSGCRCFIIGNGPSISSMDLSALAGEYTFGLNRIYLKFRDMGFPTSFLVAVNRYVIEQFSDEIGSQPCTKFISWNYHRKIADSRLKKEVIFVPESLRERFCASPADGLWSGGTVTFVAMQLAYYLGFSKVILIGVDHSFSASGEPHKLVQSQGIDVNHFDSNYFGPGIRWQLPDLDMSERAYVLAKAAFESDGRTIVDATHDGKLEIFPKASFRQLFSP